MGEKAEQILLYGLTIFFFGVAISFFLLHNKITLEPGPMIEETKIEDDSSDIKLDTALLACAGRTHLHDWKRNHSIFNKGLKTKFKICDSDFQSSRLNRSTAPLPARDRYTKINKYYEDVAKHDRELLNEIVKQLKALSKSNTYNARETAEMVVSFIQDIPYVLVHNKSCEFWETEICNSEANQNSFMCLWHNNKYPYLPRNGNTTNPCEESVEPFGVQSPIEFMYNLNGDCDTRTLFLHTVLEKMGFDCVILNSDIKGHSIFGINLKGDYFSKYFVKSPTQKYLVWETTGKFPAGQIRGYDQSHWYIAHE